MINEHAIDQDEAGRAMETTAPANPPKTPDELAREEFCQYETIAALAYETVREWCVIIGEDPAPPWGIASPAIRQGTIDGVRFVIEKPHTSLADQHDNWRAARAADGWEHGPVLSRAEKKHPNMVHFDKLPWTQQVKDRLFRHIVHAIVG